MSLISFAQSSSPKQKPFKDFSKAIKGHFILDGAECAGFEFYEKEVIWRNESACMYPDTFLLYWVDSNSFMAKEKKSETVKISGSPMIWFYTVKSFDGNELKLCELWTGWGPFKTETQKFLKVRK
ncbi:hypothetical protein [Dyadobacter sp. MSC1_007]|jgi:hypothetical protein|uniref:hypothetical protein n=1 Tax=Dyadobacter sp. MSC1_007 TaxID=2909264 RepID=UPI002030DB10|nr:hypothetical protein [Dyadobacter sp. MSC1_007]